MPALIISIKHKVQVRTSSHPAYKIYVSDAGDLLPSRLLCLQVVYLLLLWLWGKHFFSASFCFSLTQLASPAQPHKGWLFPFLSPLLETASSMPLLAFLTSPLSRWVRWVSREQNCFHYIKRKRIESSIFKKRLQDYIFNSNMIYF